MSRRDTIVEPLERRAVYVRERIESGELSAGALGWMTAELDALDYAVAVLGDMIDRDSDKAVDVPRQRELDSWRTAAGRALLTLGDHDQAAAERIMAKGPDGIRAVVGRLHEQRTYGRAVPRADDTRPRRFTDVLDHVVLDESVPPGELHLRHPDGRVDRITGLG